MSDLLSVSDALQQMLAHAEPKTSELVALNEAGGRIVYRSCKALRTQPPFPASAMDGYAVRQADVKDLPVTLNQIGESAAGHRYRGKLRAGCCVRIFTGAPVPEGADTIIIQENAEADGDAITVLKSEVAGRYIRKAGLDFEEHDVLLDVGMELTPQRLALAAAMNHSAIAVSKQPKVALISSGDELVLPGETPDEDQIICSNSFGVAEIVRRAGGDVVDCGIASDTLESLAAKLSEAEDADIVVTLGGASVGDHDLVQQSLREIGVTMNFWKLAMRPGKPVMFGHKTTGNRKQLFLGLPGNPVSSFVCALVFLVPLIRQMLGAKNEDQTEGARLAVDLPANDQREEYMRAKLDRRDGKLFVTPFETQDSSILSILAVAECLLIRPAHAPASKRSDDCKIIRL